jgi:flavin reductase (DIM6/NTAB) family NADH-FMN oxidoreductase RutF
MSGNGFTREATIQHTMQHFSIQTFGGWERFYRANFVNSLTGFKPVSLIATVNSVGQPNIGVFSSIVHLGSDPALIGYINRPLAAAPHTIENIKATGVYTINHILPAFADKAHQCSAKYGAEVNEFDEVGLTAEYKAGIEAPFVQESLVQYALKLVEIVPIMQNQTFLVIGALTDVFLPPQVVLSDGLIELSKAESLACNGADSYYTTVPLARYAYAKPGVPPTLLQ